jgi:hypothetical protein
MQDKKALRSQTNSFWFVGSLVMRGNLRKIGNVHKGIVEGRKDAGDTEDELAYMSKSASSCSSSIVVSIRSRRSLDVVRTIADLRTERDVLLLALNLLSLGGHFC